MAINALILLAAVFATAGAHYMLIWGRHFAGREHLWFALACFSAAFAAFAAVAPAMALDGTSADGLPAMQEGLTVGTSIWLTVTAWFTVEYATGNYKRRRVAVSVTLLLAIAALGDMESFIIGDHAIAWARARSAASFAALILILGLVVDGAIRLWSSALYSRSWVLAVGIGLVTVAALLQLLLWQRGVLEGVPLALSAFLIAVGMMTYELSCAIADVQAAAKRQQQELAHASRLSIVGELTASIAHEINQPLGAILSNAEAGEILLGHPNPPLDEIRQILEDVRRDGLRASNVIRHVRMLVRKRELEMAKLDANVVVADVVAFLEPEARRRRIPIASVLWPQHAYVRGDRTYLEQVLINLVLNAIDAVEIVGAVDSALPAPAPIVIGVSSTRHREIEFWIRDAGPGVPVERLSHLFDSFYTSKPHGMGLGLSIARSIAEAHGGRIRMENNRDTGATFRVVLPPYDEGNDSLQVAFATD